LKLVFAREYLLYILLELWIDLRCIATTLKKVLKSRQPKPRAVGRRPFSVLQEEMEKT